MPGVGRSSCSACRPSINTTKWRRLSPANLRGTGRTALGQTRQDRAELAVPHEWLTAAAGDVRRPVAIDHRHEARDQFVACEVGQAAQRDFATQVLVVVGVAVWAAQGTFLGEFDRNIG